MKTIPTRVRACCVVMAAGMLFGGCSGSLNPVSPTRTGNASDVSAAVTAIAGPTSSRVPVTAQAAGRPTPAELERRGWTCFAPPIPTPPTVCSHPNQGFPVIADPPPPDRPATFTFWIYREGSFVGTELLIRSDLYTGQLCESTGEPYVYAALIGYHECIHTTGN
jgi:hypothetical protein